MSDRFWKHYYDHTQYVREQIDKYRDILCKKYNISESIDNHAIIKKLYKICPERIEYKYFNALVLNPNDMFLLHRRRTRIEINRLIWLILNNITNRQRRINKLLLLFEREKSRYMHVINIVHPKDSIDIERRRIFMLKHSIKYDKYCLNSNCSIRAHNSIVQLESTFHSNKIITMFKYIGAVIAFCPLMRDEILPPYVIMWILDYLPYNSLLRASEKIHVIANIRNMYNSKFSVEN